MSAGEVIPAFIEIENNTSAGVLFGVIDWSVRHIVLHLVEHCYLRRALLMENE